MPGSGTTLIRPETSAEPVARLEKALIVTGKNWPIFAPFGLVNTPPGIEESEMLKPVGIGSIPDIKGIRFLDGGNAVGYVLEFENGFKIYHSGDTDVFGDMALIHRFYKPDLALVCIGGHFTMDPERAAYALRELIRPKQVIPMHYGTYPAHQSDARRAQGGARQRADQGPRCQARRRPEILREATGYSGTPALRKPSAKCRRPPRFRRVPERDRRYRERIVASHAPRRSFALIASRSFEASCAAPSNP